MKQILIEKMIVEMPTVQALMVEQLKKPVEELLNSFHKDLALENDIELLVDCATNDSIDGYACDLVENCFDVNGDVIYSKLVEIATSMLKAQKSQLLEIQKKAKSSLKNIQSRAHVCSKCGHKL